MLREKVLSLYTKCLNNFNFFLIILENFAEKQNYLDENEKYNL